MAKVNRVEKPRCLQNYKFDKTKKTWILSNKKINWDTNTKKNNNAKIEVKKVLMEMCDNTCPFSFITSPPELFFEIEHFKPKSKFLELEFEWDNLFPIYRYINTKKSTNFPEGLESPEEIDYLKILRFNTFKGTDNYGKVEPVDNSKDAKIIINTYKLNDENLIQARIFWFELTELKTAKYPFKQLF